LVLLLAACLPLDAAGSQEGTEHYFGFNSRLGPEQVDGIRMNMRKAEQDCRTIEQPCAPASQVLDTLFGSTFRRSLPDVLVYVETQDDGSLKTYRPLLLWNGKNTPYVFGARHLYLLMISDKRLPLDAKLTTIIDKSQNPLAGFQALLKFTPAEPAAKEPMSKTVAVAWTPLGTSSGGPFLGWARLDIEVDSVNRLTVSERPVKVTGTLKETTRETGKAPETETEVERVVEGPEPLPPGVQPLPNDAAPAPFRELTAHISDSRSAHAGVGVALGATLNVADTGLGNGSGDVHENAYALAKLYALRPRLRVGPTRRSVFRPSLAVVVGTNVASDPFEELIGGISVGHVIGKLGFMVGVNLVKPEAPMDDAEGDMGGSEDRSRKYRLFLGVDYSF
jgi:hypothetical protein